MMVMTAPSTLARVLVCQVREGGRIFSHYLVTWFPVDLIATIPYEGIVLISPAELSETESRLIQLLRIPRLLRLARLLRFFDRLRGANVSTRLAGHAPACRAQGVCVYVCVHVACARVSKFAYMCVYVVCVYACECVCVFVSVYLGVNRCVSGKIGKEPCILHVARSEPSLLSCQGLMFAASCIAEPSVGSPLHMLRAHKGFD